MADITARFKIIDEISAKLDAIGQSGEEAANRMAAIGTFANAAFEEISTGSVSAVKACDGVATAVTSAAEQTTAWESALSDAAQQAVTETQRLGEETEKYGMQSKDSGEMGVDAIEALEGALQSAGIAVLLKEIYDGFVECAEAAEQVETEAAKISTIADKSQMSLTQINQSTVALSNDTGKAATALLDSVYNAISAGVETASAVQFVDKANQLAVGGFTSATTAVDVLTTAINAYGLSVNDAAQISDYLITSQNLGKLTVDEMAQSVGNVIPLAAAYGVEMGNLSTAYAIMTANGIATAETGTYLKSILSELGDSGSEVAKILMDQTGNSFAGLTAEGYSLGDVLDILGDSVNGDATAFANLWASTEAGIGALSLFNSGAERYNSVLEEMEASTGAASKAYEIMANTTEAAHNRMTVAAENLQVSIGSALNPTLGDLYDSVADVTGAMAGFVSDHPGVVKAVTAVTVGIGAAAAAVAGYNAATKIAIPLAKAFGAALSKTPTGALALGITAVVAAGTSLIAMVDKVEDETLSMTAATREQYFELQELESAYNEACNTYGETSEEASRLRYQVEDLSDAFERNQQTVDEFAAQCQSVIDAHDEMIQQIEKNRAAIEDSSTQTFALIQKLSDLADGTYQSANSQAVMKAIIDDLNGSMEGLNLTYADLIVNQDATISNLLAMAEAQAQQEIMNERLDEFVNLTKELALAEEGRKSAVAEMTEAQEWANEANARYSDYLWQISQYDTTGFGALGAMFSSEAKEAKAANTELEAATAHHAEIIASISDYEARLQSLTEQFGFTSDAIADSEDAAISWEYASTAAFESVQNEMETLIQSYSDAYTAALESFEGQFEFFDRASTKSEEYLSSTVANAQTALDSQLAYWESYSANIETLQGVTAEQLGITQENYEALMVYVQDGSEQAAGLAASMVKNINSGNEEAVAELANTMADVTATREEIATKTAEWVTDFSGKMDELTTKMVETVDSLNLNAEAADAAHATIQAYADSILANKTAAVDAATQIADAVEAALTSTSARVKVSVTDSTPRYATGTTNAEEAFIAGEDGPELILHHEGATVFPTSETERIVNAVNGMNGANSASFADEFDAAIERLAALQITAPGAVLAHPERVSAPVSHPGSRQGQEKTIRLEIVGSGSMGVGNGTTKEEVVELLVSNLKPALLSIVQEEIFEEGDRSYDF